MKRIKYSFSFMLLSILLSGCVTSGYFSDRGNDLLDIATLTMSLGLGVKARIGPFHAGLNVTSADIGLRGGAIEEDYGGPCNHFTGNELFFVGYERFWPSNVYWGNKLRCQMKTYYTDDTYLPFITPAIQVYDSSTENKISDSSFKNMISHPYITQIEAQASFIYGLRVGFNIGELLDFILGWTTLDIYGDDIGITEEKGNKNQTKIQDQDNIPEILRDMQYVDMFGKNYTTQHPLICIPGGDYPDGSEMIFMKQSNPKEWVHAVFPKQIIVPKNRKNKVVLHGCFQNVQNIDNYRIKRVSANYEYFIVSSWEYQK